MIEQFLSWFHRESRVLRELTAEQAAERIQGKLADINEELSVEVADGEPRELVISASGNTELFDLVESIVGQLGTVPGWRVYALKPAQGFEFEHESAGEWMNVAALRFEPLASKEYPGEVGIRVFVPEGIELGDDALWVIVATGLGERRAAKIGYLEAAKPPEDSERFLELRELGAYLDWHLARRESEQN